MDLTKDVADAEYFTRSIAYYLRREPYLPAVETYIKKLAEKHGVSIEKVRNVRAAYVKKHPLDWQRKTKQTKKTKKTKQTKRKSNTKRSRG
jgi:hypothetical protein